MENKQGKQPKLKVNWFWGTIGFLGILGFILKEPAFYSFFVFFLFFLEPVAGSLTSRSKTPPSKKED